MANQPSNLLIKLSQRLFPEPGERDAFVEALVHPQEFASTILWTRPRPEGDFLPKELPLPWQPEWVDRLSSATRPGQHPLHEQGYFYCLDFSSVFAASALSGIAAPTPTVLDLCAAPGGKSLFAWRALQPEQLWCNEVVRKRVRILISNLKRCGATSALVFNQDPSAFAEQMPRSASLVLVDAPCSGQSLLAKGETALGCFHPVNLNKNANRQKRILANAAEVVAGQGYLAYMTCTFSPEENEQVCEWFLGKFPQFQPVSVTPLAAYPSHLADWPCYRLWPQSGLGAGAFTALFRNTGDEALAVNPDFLKQHGMILYTAEGGTVENRSNE
ncbi:MAG: RsmB/NOP family class I SAM-dependent RNA methyltransferase [Cyanobacteria bacterium Co-bin13]|nr:RsmB/NOP family class I SAM-dependent RNA methyltransferase [Cyanobacteria bacterium Co-bin13]